jgi:oxygen-independent coproporphyrinogen-3 oxidase
MIEIGSSFVSNYPPFAAWTADALDAVRGVLQAPPARPAPLGVYVHVPFCRKRCRFCYFKVYTETPSAEIRAYLDALGREAAMAAALPAIRGRTPSFVYFGGGTPSYLSADQLRELFGAIRTALPWSDEAEITFECEPGTLREPKVEALRQHGVTRLSIGVESFDQALLELNGRAHTEANIEPAFRMARAAGFPQINLDLIAGMVGETDTTWAYSLDRTLELGPDSVTIYPLEIPANTTIARAVRAGEDLGGPVAPMAGRRRWVEQAFERLEAAGYTLSSGYTAVRGPQRFVYRDSLWRGADLVPLGVSAFGHVQGAHLQSDKDLDAYVARVQAGELPLQRGYVLTDEERLIRELVLQLKLGHISVPWFRERYGVDVGQRFAAQWAVLGGLVERSGAEITLTRAGLLQVDSLLAPFFLVEHGGHTMSERAA